MPTPQEQVQAFPGNPPSVVKKKKNREGRFTLDKVGTDCELFLVDQKGNPVPAIGLVGGSKDKPRKVINKEGFAVQEDNVMLEFNIPPAHSADDFAKKIGTILEYCKKEMAKQDLSLHIVPSCVFDEKQLSSPQAKAIGCEPDFCVWTRSKNKVKFSKETKLLRSSGGHVHISYTFRESPRTIRDLELVVKACDLFLGVPSVILDKDLERKKLYGKAGAFRPKDYGVEYRTLSNFWIKSPELIKWAYNSVEAAFNFLNHQGWDMETIFESHGNMIHETINNQNEIQAKAVLAYYTRNFRAEFPEFSNIK